MSDEIGGLGHVKLYGGTSERIRNPLCCFNIHDQDALSARQPGPADQAFWFHASGPVCCVSPV